jgi:DNA-directed RNA polymerase subunit N (RpoN/RPB10)
MNCGKAIADKWLFYQQQLKELKRAAGQDTEMPFYMDATTVPQTPEKKLLDYLGLTRSCCRKHFLTQKDLMDKI